MHNHQDPTPDAPEPAQGGTRVPNLAQPFQPTPEPWKIAHSNYANASFVIYGGEIDPKWDRRYPLTCVDWIAVVKHDESEQHQEQIANARLIQYAPRMRNLLEHLAEILAPHPTLDTQAQIDGANSAAVAIARKRVDEFLAELEGGAQ